MEPKTIKASSPAEAVYRFAEVLLAAGADPGDVIAGLGSALCRLFAASTPRDIWDDGTDVMIGCLRAHMDHLKAEYQKGMH